jgi:flagellar hook-basal body complex protein FliE
MGAVMDATTRAATNAYQALTRLGQPGAVQPGGEGDGADFGQLVRTAVVGFAEQARATEQRGQAFAAGRGELVDVVTAVAETEVALETLVSVRDRVIQAYEEIMRMPI